MTVTRQELEPSSAEAKSAAGGLAASPPGRARGLPFLPAGVGLVLLLAAGVIHGTLTHRWGSNLAVEQAARQLAHIPHVIGRWTSEPVEIPQDQLRMAEAQGAFSRKYRDPDHGQEIHVLILCGAPGPISVHPPEVCLTSAGFHMAEAPRSREVRTGRQQHLFRTALFNPRPQTNESAMRVYWSWNAEGRWSVPDNPRLAFGQAPVLYKMYVTRAARGDNLPSSDQSVLDFLQLLLPTLQQVLFESRD